MAERLLNKTAVLTGAGSGIGRALAERFLNEGAKVVLFGRNQEPLDEVVNRFPARALAIAGNVTSINDLESLADEARRRFGSIDLLVPCAGTARAMPLADTAPERVEELLGVNLQGVIQTVRTVLPVMSGKGAILLVSGGRQAEGLAVYNASKAAVSSLVGDWARELAPRGIRVNGLRPGRIESRLWAKHDIPAETDFPVTADDVAEAAVYLASDVSGGITGQELVID